MVDTIVGFACLAIGCLVIGIVLGRITSPYRPSKRDGLLPKRGIDKLWGMGQTTYRQSVDPIPLSVVTAKVLDTAKVLGTANRQGELAYYRAVEDRINKKLESNYNV